MSEKCIYCSQRARSRKRVPAGNGQYVCEACAEKSQEYLVQLLRRWNPSIADRFLPDPPPEPETQTKKKKKKKMKNLNLLTLSAILALGVFTGATIRCDVDDGDDKDKDKSAEFIDVHGHDIQDAVSEALPGALVNFEDPDYQCMAIGSIDREKDTDFDVLFITACHALD